MNDMDFLQLVDNIREGLLFLLNSSLFWLFTGLYFIFNTLHIFSRSLRFNRWERDLKQPVKSWCYDD